LAVETADPRELEPRKAARRTRAAASAGRRNVDARVEAIAW